MREIVFDTETTGLKPEDGERIVEIGAVELVNQLVEAGFLVGVGSSGPPENIALTLDRMEIADRVSAVATGADVDRGKPDPQVFELAAERIGVPPSHCAVIEDAPQGVEAANRAGMVSIALTSTQAPDQLTHADLTIKELRELSPSRIADMIRSAAASN